MTRQPGWRDGGATAAGSLAEALAVAAVAPGGGQVWVMGGAQVYAEALPHADRLVVTEIDLEVEGDTFAPAIDPQEWRALDDSSWAASSGPGALRYRIRTLTRAPR